MIVSDASNTEENIPFSLKYIFKWLMLICVSLIFGVLGLKKTKKFSTKSVKFICQTLSLVYFFLKF